MSRVPRGSSGRNARAPATPATFATQIAFIGQRSQVSHESQRVALSGEAAATLHCSKSQMPHQVLPDSDAPTDRIGTNRNCESGNAIATARFVQQASFGYRWHASMTTRTIPMSNKMEWNPSAARSREELQDVLFFAAAGLKTQVLSSPALGENDFRELKARISEIADTIHGLQAEVRLGDQLPDRSL